jgi:hypothetical protein
LPLILASVHFEPGPDAVPLGAACVASALKAAFPQISVRLVESFIADGAGALVEKILLAGGRNAVGFSLYCWNRSICVEAAAVIRTRCPGVFLFCGGPEAKALPAGLSVDEGGPFDAVIPGEGERAAVELLGRRLFGEAAGSPGFTGAAAGSDDLATLPSPWLDNTLDPAEREGILWELARGCPYACAYCFESKGLPALGSHRVRYVPEERLRQEVKLFARSAAAGGKYIFVLDPTFNTNNKRALGILAMIEEEAGALSTIHWHFEVRAELLTGEQARQFARLGASLQIGLQTANREVAVRINRGFDPRLFARKIGLLNREGLSFGLDLIYGLPEDSLDGYKRSLDYALSLYPNNLDLFRLALLPGTVLADKAAAFGLEAESAAPYLVRATPAFPREDLDRAEALSGGTDLFYNEGRAVAWFNQALRPLRIRSSVFLEEFTAWAGEQGALGKKKGAVDAEKLQLAFLEKLYARKKKEKLLPALRDIVRYHGAWGRALAEGAVTDIDFTYHPDDILGTAMDLERFVGTVRPRPTRIHVGLDREP